jgi:hypothetical protein
VGHLDGNACGACSRRSPLPPSRSGSPRLDVRHLRKAFQWTRCSRVFTRLERPDPGTFAPSRECRRGLSCRA